MATIIKFHGRSKPYTEIGIRRINCCRCGKKSTFQWNCCANGNRWMPICRQCDVDLNEMVLKFFRFANSQALLSAYKAKIGWSEIDDDPRESLRATAQAGLDRACRCNQQRTSEAQPA